ncbi:MAG: DUF167 domain-containing protein [Cyanobacteria bacterium]|nr:DUF167 domain-containing protein [Cyanobacteria bacterium CG_2015-16_32_12]NCO79429.1 DUF167 domain-containing protein [Cyanobacteria bacterium CG_2015-22_32_23]NCQ05595.1 DUF167 domain-containing protein [Cyanobacteria bacterium CG_2015-09_32_10]NCQ42323.1 DUF167 domain-containing protein [Cyanobacteria bacterium CG_2015-04_32_10]NCS85079.1 DUF167 domain-containing protein [Cyanobacteria bacterium CG_2015-02_32_10]
MKISVKVKPKSKQQKIEQNPEGVWIIHLKSPPIDGKANQELIKVIADKFKVKKSQVIIKSGLSSHNKIIEIED